MNNRHPAPAFVAMLLLLLAQLLVPQQAAAQGIDLANRPISEIHIEGLNQVPEQLVRNQIRLAPGEPYQPEVVQEDIVRITYLGRFASVQARVEPQQDGSVVLTYVLQEQPLLVDVQVVGNKAVPDQELMELILLRAGDPADPFLVDRGVQQIERAYEQRGFFLSDVTVDRSLLDEQGILIFRVREGPKLRIQDIDFEGNTVFSDKELSSRIRSREHVFILRKGELNREQLESDTASVRDFYRDRGYLDAQVGRRIDVSEDQKDARIVFLIEEGRQYQVGEIRVQGNELFPDDQLLLAMPLKVGAVYSAADQRKSVAELTDMYGKLGFLQTNVQIDRLFHDEQPLVDVLVRVDEGRQYKVGTVMVRGNETTKDKVILRQVRGIEPGRPFDRAGIALTERRLRESSLFSGGQVTLLGELDDEYRDVLVEVTEQNTGSVSLGAGISSDAGVLGSLDLTQRNFDIADVPESFGEFLSGRAFRGAGQYFSLNIQPGSERSLYQMVFREPYLLDTNYFFDSRLFFFDREREDWTEERVGASVGFGQRFGDIWSARISSRFENIEITDVQPEAPVDVFDDRVQGDHLLTVLGLSITRDTTDSRIFPTRGSSSSASIERAGALGGDYDFTRIAFDTNKFWTVDEDFFGRKTVLRMRAEVGHILESDEAPIFERFFAGGHRSFRGFDYRGVGPRAIQNNTMTKGDAPAGGDWMFLLGFEYNYPIYEETLRGVLFVDTGTIDTDLSFSDYRVSVGAGVRLKIPFLGQAPLALDLAIPVMKEEDDQTQYFSFDFSVPF